MDGHLGLFSLTWHEIVNFSFPLFVVALHFAVFTRIFGLDWVGLE